MRSTEYLGRSSEAKNSEKVMSDRQNNEPTDQWSDGPTDQWTDRLTDGQTNGGTVKVECRVAYNTTKKS